MATTAQELDLGRYQLGWSDVEDFYVFKPKRGLNEDIVREMSWMKGEPEWMTQRRLKALRYFERRPMPKWGGDLSGIDFDNIFYYIKPIDKQVSAWDQLPDSVKATYDKLGHPRGGAQVPCRRHGPVRDRRSSTTATGTSWPARASCSAIWTRRCGSTPTSSNGTSAL